VAVAEDVVLVAVDAVDADAVDLAAAAVIAALVAVAADIRLWFGRFAPNR
jgi:hypothetical protein